MGDEAGRSELIVILGEKRKYTKTLDMDGAQKGNKAIWQLEIGQCRARKGKGMEEKISFRFFTFTIY